MFPTFHFYDRPLFFRVNAGFGAGDAFGVNGGVHVGNPLQSNFLFPIIIGLWLLSLFNIVLTIITPLLNKKDEAAAADDADPADAARGFNNMDLAIMANNVMEAIEKFQKQQKEA